MSEYKKLTRSNTNKMISGVCGGLGDFLDIDPTIVRLLFAFGFIASFGTAFLVYLVLAIVIPPEENTKDET
ncbi:MAG TPA: PspC domain-containing protein [Anaerolineales bacterium]|nr:PspC domain-containing protein [Anaerolineales bacterium]